MGSAASLGLIAALSYGIGDFLNGALSRRLPAATLLLFGQGAALLILIPTSTLLPGHAGSAALAWGAASGLTGTAGSYCLLRGYRYGRLAVVSPAASVAAAGLPVLADLARGVNVSPLAGTGVVVALLAVVLVGARPTPRASEQQSPATADERRRQAGSGLGWGLAAGAAHAAMYLLLAQAPAGSGLWPVTALFVVLAALTAATSLARRNPVLPAPHSVPGLLIIGVFSAAGTVGFLLATNAGSVGIAAVTTELSPVATAVLARLFLREHLPPLRVAGLVLAVLASALIGLG